MRKRIKEDVLGLIAEFAQSGELQTIIQTELKEMLSDDEFLRKIGKAMDVAEAMRITNEVNRDVEEMTAKELEMSDSPEPWFEWVCLGVDPEKGEKMHYAFNNAFVQHMKSIGIQGDTPDDMFLRYVGLIGTDALLEDYD